MSSSVFKARPSHGFISSEIPVQNPHNITETTHERCFGGIGVEREHERSDHAEAKTGKSCKSIGDCSDPERVEIQSGVAVRDACGV